MIRHSHLVAIARGWRLLYRRKSAILIHLIRPLLLLLLLLLRLHVRRKDARRSLTIWREYCVSIGSSVTIEQASFRVDRRVVGKVLLRDHSLLLLLVNALIQMNVGGIECKRRR